VLLNDAAEGVWKKKKENDEDREDFSFFYVVLTLPAKDGPVYR